MSCIKYIWLELGILLSNPKTRRKTKHIFHGILHEVQIPGTVICITNIGWSRMPTISKCNVICRIDCQNNAVGLHHFCYVKSIYEPVSCVFRIYDKFKLYKLPDDRPSRPTNRDSVNWKSDHISSKFSNIFIWFCIIFEDWVMSYSMLDDVSWYFKTLYC